MFFATQNQTRHVLSFLALATLTTLTPLPAAGGMPIAPTCSGIPQLDAGATGNAHAAGDSIESCFEVQSNAGILLLDLATPGAHSRMTVEVCPGSEPTATTLLDASPGQRILQLDRPASFLVCGVILDATPGQRVLRTAWTAAAKNQQIEIEPDNNVDGENQQIEIEPDHEVAGENVDGEDVDDKNQQIEIEPDAFTTLCRGHARDDHADLDLCATTQWQTGMVHGRIDHPGDRDVLVLELEQLATLVLEVNSEGPVVAELVDSRGNRLASFADGGPKIGAFTTLAAGTYFLRISGAPQGWRARFEIL